MKLKTKEQVQKAAEIMELTKRTLELLFPEAFENEQKFCEIGSIFFRRTYTNNIYAIVKHENCVKVLNINYSTLWAVKHKLYVTKLTDPNREYITVDEFKKLTGYVNLDEFVVINKSDIYKLRNAALSIK